MIKGPNVHKNDFGHVLVVAGSAPMLGAAALCALAAMRAGAGLVTCAIARSLNLTLQKKLSAIVMTLPLPESAPGVLGLSAYKILAANLAKFNAVAVGPGLGQHTHTQKFVFKLLAECPKPLVIDADALNILAQQPKILLKNPRVKILTPHTGEMSRLTGRSVAVIERRRSQTALECARAYKSIVVLKGHRTVIASPDGKIKINRSGNAGMATAGSGDVLTGIIAALLGQGLEPFKAACMGVNWHGRAGDLAAKYKTQASMIATDIIEYLPAALF